MKRANSYTRARLLAVGFMMCGLASGCSPSIPSPAPPAQTTTPHTPEPAAVGAFQPTPCVDPQVTLPAETPVNNPDGQPPPQPTTPEDLGPPLVEDLESLERLHPTYPVWVDKKNRSVVMQGEVCQREVPLELFACTRNSKEHESVVVIDTKAYVVHAGLLAVGAEPGAPVRFSPEFAPARGTEIDVTVAYKDEQGEIRRARAQDWICHIDTEKPMEYPWVFAGSQMLTDEQTGRQYYQADGEGDLICVSNFPSAVLDIPARSSTDSSALLFKANPEKVPARGTPVTIILTPRLQPQETPGQDKPPQQPSHASEGQNS